MIYFPNDSGRILRILKNNGYKSTEKTKEYKLYTYGNTSKVLETEKYSIIICPEIGQLKITENIFRVLKATNVTEINIEKYVLLNIDSSKKIQVDDINYEIYDKKPIELYFGTIKSKKNESNVFVSSNDLKNDFLELFLCEDQNNYTQINPCKNIDSEIIELINCVRIR